MRELYELKGKGRGQCAGSRSDLGISRDTVRKYVRSSQGVPKSKPRAKRGIEVLDAYKEYIDVRLSEGLENCVVLQREITELGYEGGYSDTEELCASADAEA